MRTLLSQFCEEFESAVRPLLEPLRRSSETLGERPDSDYARAVLPNLLDVADQFTVLADKVAEQQAYVLIFGPLKSGKSTLMNAMSAAYVSEVTSLPAYPCMVFVSDSDKRKFTVARYNGDVDVFQDPAALRMQVARAHTDLAEMIRQVEGRGEEFDPAQHFDEAIRRIDVKVPAGDLAQSGSVLVDTPGLYSRMKFGYDRMTKEFRNAAACAIFVVKTDNLFLEQVFNEFNQLLDLFSRIFLVVNLDGTKKDVMPDGTLVPSLESDDPIRVVEAFENLAMSAPLKAAADEGRLRIYPVDLMNAASSRLAGRDEGQEPEPGGIATSGQADFDEFMRDLSDYLNSTDYLVAFLGDSLRRAMTLLAEANEAAEHPTIRAIAGRMTELEAEHRACNDKLQALDRLETYDWSAALTNLRRDLADLGALEAAEVAERSAHQLSDSLDRWFQSDASLHSLIKNDLAPLINSSQRQLALCVHQRLSQEVASGSSGVSLPHEVARDLFALGLQFGEFGRCGLDELDPVAGIATEDSPLESTAIPVKKSLWDWLLFRSAAKVRERLFGAPAAPSLRIPREIKGKRLGDEARRMMQAKLTEYQEGRFPELLEGLVLRIFDDYARAVTSGLSARFGACRGELQEQMAELQAQLKQYRKVLNRVEELAIATARTRSSIEELAQRYQEADPDKLVQPIAPTADKGHKPPANIQEAFVEPSIEEPALDESVEELELEE